MKYFNLFKVSFTLFSVAVFTTFTSCKQDNRIASNDGASAPIASYDVSLNDAVFIKDKHTFNLHWDSNIPVEKVSYNILINEELFLSNVSKTIINELENTIEFNVPQTDFSLDNSKLLSGLNTIQIEANIEDATIAKSNVITIDNTEATYVASR